MPPSKRRTAFLVVLGVLALMCAGGSFVATRWADSLLSAQKTTEAVNDAFHELMGRLEPSYPSEEAFFVDLQAAAQLELRPLSDEGILFLLSHRTPGGEFRTATDGGLDPKDQAWAQTELQAVRLNAGTDFGTFHDGTGSSWSRYGVLARGVDVEGEVSLAVLAWRSGGD